MDAVGHFLCLFSARIITHAVNCGRFCFWRRQSAYFWFMYEISRKPLNGLAPNSHGKCVWSHARTNLKVKVKGQGHRGQKRYLSALSAACVRSMFGKISLASGFNVLCISVSKAIYNILSESVQF